MHRFLLLLIVGMTCTNLISCCITELETGPSLAVGAFTAANAVINQSGSEQCLRGKPSNVVLRFSNSCDVSGHSSTACELASQIADQDSEISMAKMFVTTKTLLDLLGDSETSH